MSQHTEAGPAIDEAHVSHGVIRYPVVFGPLTAPFGIASGYVSVTLAFLLRDAGLSVALIAGLVALSTWPQTIKMLWAPLVDTIGNPKIWFGLGTIGVGLSILTMSLLPRTEAEVPIFMVMIVLSSLASSFTAMTAEIFLANLVPPEMSGSACGWNQAGNLGGAGIGGGIGLLLAENLAQPWISGAVLAAICFACWSAVLFVPRLEVVRTEGLNYLRKLREVIVNVWEVLRSRKGYLAFIIMVLPIGSGAAPWSAIAQEWHVSGNLVALVNGLAAGAASIVGALAAGYVCNRMDPKRAYCMFGIFVGLVAAVLIVLPRTPMVFVAGVLGYQAMLGMAYTGYAAIVLEAIGKKSAATNWNLLAAISNIPIASMAMVDGHVHDAWGTNAMLAGELILPAIAIAGFWLFVAATASRSRAPA